MGILSAIWKLIKKIFSAIFSWLADIFGDLFLILLIIVLIYFAPMIAVWLTSVGAPAFMVTAFEFLALATPYVTTAVTWLWEGGASLMSAAWSAFSGLSTGTQAAIAVGAASLIAPEETAEVIEEATNLVGTGVTAIASGILSTPTGLMIAAGLAWWFLFRDDSQDEAKAQDRLKTKQMEAELRNAEMRAANG